MNVWHGCQMAQTWSLRKWDLNWDGTLQRDTLVDPKKLDLWRPVNKKTNKRSGKQKKLSDEYLQKTQLEGVGVEYHFMSGGCYNVDCKSFLHGCQI